MSWAGSIALTNGQARGAMVDPWDWEIALGGSLGWTGSLGGALRLSSTSPLGTSPIGLRGEPL